MTGDVVRKRRSFKMTQNTFDKIRRRLPVALEYSFLEDKLDIDWSTSQPNLRLLGSLEGCVSFCQKCIASLSGHGSSLKLISLLSTLFLWQNYMEINYDPKLKTNLHKKRMYFWDKMVWTERELAVEKKQLYKKSTEFILDLQ